MAYQSDVALYTVYHDERGAVAGALQTAHIEGGIHIVVGARSVERDESVALTQDGVADVLGTALVDCLVADD